MAFRQTFKSWVTKDGRPQKPTVFYWDEMWLKRCLRQLPIDITFVNLTNCDQKEWTSHIKLPSLLIFCYEHKSSSSKVMLVEKLEYIQKTYGHSKEIFVIDFVKDTMSVEKLDVSKYIRSNMLLTITQTELNIMDGGNTEYLPAMRNMINKLTTVGKILKARESSSPRTQKIGIFSRSDTEDYSWLTEVLRSKAFGDYVEEVKPCYICNSFSVLSDKASQCTFGILYHTKNRGRINITDIKDSLYDEELEYLCQRLGKDKVIVIIDDVTDSSDQKKISILQSQPSMKEWAKEVFLISEEEKRSDYQKYLTDLAGVTAKLNRLEAVIKNNSNDDKTQTKSNTGYCWPL